MQRLRPLAHPTLALSNLVRTYHCHNFNFSAAQQCFKVFKGRFRISRKPPISKFLSPPTNFSAFQNWMIKVFGTQLERLKKKHGRWKVGRARWLFRLSLVLIGPWPSAHLVWSWIGFFHRDCLHRQLLLLWTFTYGSYYLDKGRKYWFRNWRC